MSFLGSNLVSVTVFKIFRIKGLWPWPITVQGHPKWSPWALYIISVGPNMVTFAVVDIFQVKSMTLIFWPFNVIQGQIWWCQSKAHRHFPIWALLSPTPYLSQFGHKLPVWPPNQPTTQGHRYNICRNRSSMQYYVLHTGPDNNNSHSTRTKRRVLGKNNVARCVPTNERMLWAI